MSLAVVCFLTFARTVVLCLFGWPVAVAIEQWFREQPEARRPFALAAILAPFLFPELLVGYAFRDVALASPLRAEWLSASLLFIRIIPIGVVVLLASPPTLISAAAIHCRWICLRANFWSLTEWWHLMRCYFRGPVRRVLPALGLMALVSFQEFELAALLQTASWTDWFIAAQRIGLDREEMLKSAVWPLAMQLPLIGGAIVWFHRKSSEGTADVDNSARPISRSTARAVMIYLGMALALGCLAPLCPMIWNLSSGLSLFIRQPAQWLGLLREVLIAAAISLCSGMIAWFASGVSASSQRAGSVLAVIRQGMILPGLIGSLLLSLVMERLFQHQWLRPFYDTPIPWVVTLVVWLLPRALLLRVWLKAITRTEGVFLAETLNREGLPAATELPTSNPLMLSSKSRSGQVAHIATLLFRLRDQPQYLAMGLLCYWAYLDLSTAYLLAPSGMASGLVRLYNFMHFGRSAALSAESFLFFGIPTVVILSAIQLLRFFRRK